MHPKRLVAASQPAGDRARRLGDWQCPRCNRRNFARNERCHFCKVPVPKSAAMPVSALTTCQEVDREARAIAVSKEARRVRLEMIAAGKTVRLLDVCDETCRRFTVGGHRTAQYLGELGFRIDEIRELDKIKQREGQIEMAMLAWWAVRLVMTLYDLEAAIKRKFAVESFNDLEMGPFLAHPFVLKYFGSSPETIAAVSATDIVEDLWSFRRRVSRIDENDFLRFEAAKRRLPGPTALGVKLKRQAIGVVVSNCSKSLKEAKKEMAKLEADLQAQRVEKYRCELEARFDNITSEARSGVVLSDRAKRDLVRFGVLAGSKLSSRELAEDMRKYCILDGKRGQRNLGVVCELAATYAAALADVNPVATRATIHEAVGLSDEEIAAEVTACCQAGDLLAGLDPIDALHTLEQSIVARLRIPSFEALNRGSFLAFMSRAKCHVKALTAVLARIISSAPQTSANSVMNVAADNEPAMPCPRSDVTASALIESAEEVLADRLADIDDGDDEAASIPPSVRALAAIEMSFVARAPRTTLSFALLQEECAKSKQVRLAVGAALFVYTASPAEQIGLGVAANTARAAIATADDDLEIARLISAAHGDTLAGLSSAAAIVGNALVDGLVLAVTGCEKAGDCCLDRATVSRALDAAPVLVNLDDWLCWSSSGLREKFGDILTFVAAESSGLLGRFVVVERTVYRLGTADTLSAESLAASVARADAPEAVAAHLCLLAAGSFSRDELLAKCWLEGLARLVFETVPTFVVEAIVVCPRPLRQRLAIPLFSSLNTLFPRGRHLGPWLLNAAASDEARTALYDLALQAHRAEQASDSQATMVFPNLVADYRLRVLGTRKGAADIRQTPQRVSLEVQSPEVKALSTKITSSDSFDLNRKLLKTSATRTELAPRFVNDALSCDTLIDENEPTWVVRDIRRQFGLEDDESEIENSLQGTALVNALKVISHDIYTQDAHFVYELIQNADDNEYRLGVVPELHVVTTPTYVVFRNNEVGFREHNVYFSVVLQWSVSTYPTFIVQVRALCHIGASSKFQGSGFIGQKGIGVSYPKCHVSLTVFVALGFKSVFRISPRPEIHSRGYRFALDSKYMIIPHPIPRDVMSAAEEDFRNEWNPCDDGTMLILPLSDEYVADEARAKLWGFFSDLNSLLLLFLNRIQRIVHLDIGDDNDAAEESDDATAESLLQGRRILQRAMSRMDAQISSTSNASVVTLLEETADNWGIEGGEEKLHWLVVRRSISTVATKAQRAGATTTTMAAAFPLSSSTKDDDGGDKDKQLPVCAFLPIRPEGFKFVLQADWILTSNRESIRQDAAWNQWLRSEIPALFADAVVSAKSGAGADFGFDATHALKALPLDREISGFFRPAVGEIARRLRSVECVQSIDSKWEIPGITLAIPSRLLGHALPLVQPKDLLWLHLHRRVLHPDFADALESQVRRALGIEDFDETHALRLMQSLHTAGDQLDVDLIRNWMILIHRAASLTGGLAKKTKICHALRSLKCIPLAEGDVLGSVKEGPIFFVIDASSHGAAPQFARGLRRFAHELRVVSPLLLKETPASASVTSVLAAMGVRDYNPKIVLEEHVLPRLADAGANARDFNRENDRGTIIGYWQYCHAYWATATASSIAKRIENVLQSTLIPVCKAVESGQHRVLRPAGLVKLDTDEVHLAAEHGNQNDLLVELTTAAQQLGWRAAALDELNELHCSLLPSWRELLLAVGVVEVCRKCNRIVPACGDDSEWWKQTVVPEIAKKRLLESGEYEVHDTKAQFLEKIVAHFATADNKNKKVISLLVRLAGILVQHPEAVGLTACVAKVTLPDTRIFRDNVIVPSAGLCPRSSALALVPSSIAYAFSTASWLPSATLELARPSDLYLNTDAVRALSGGHEPRPHLSITNVINDDGLKLLGVRDVFETPDLLALLDRISASGKEANRPRLKSSLTHFNQVYVYLKNNGLRGPYATTVRERFFVDQPIIWVPDYRPDEMIRGGFDDCAYVTADATSLEVDGTFYRPSETVWADNSRLVDSLHLEKGFRDAPRVLLRHYPNLRDFFCRTLCKTCFGSGFGSIGKPGCLACVDAGVSQGSPTALVATSPKLETYLNLALRVAATDGTPFAKRREDVCAMLNTISFAVLVNRLDYETVAAAFRNVPIWPTVDATFVSVDEVPLVADCASDRELVELFSACVPILDLPVQTRVREIELNYFAESGTERQFLVDRLGEFTSVDGLSDLSYGCLFERFKKLASTSDPLTKRLGIRKLVDVVEMRVVPSHVDSYSAPQLFDDVARACGYAQRYLRSLQPQAYAKEHLMWRCAVERLRICVADSVEVVYTLHQLHVKSSKESILADSSVLYVARRVADNRDLDPVFDALASLFPHIAHPKQLSDLLYRAIAAKDPELVLQRCGVAPLDPDAEDPWVASALRAAAQHTPAESEESRIKQVSIKDSVDEEDDENHALIRRARGVTPGNKRSEDVWISDPNESVHREDTEKAAELENCFDTPVNVIRQMPLTSTQRPCLVDESVELALKEELPEDNHSISMDRDSQEKSANDAENAAIPHAQSGVVHSSVHREAATLSDPIQEALQAVLNADSRDTLTAAIDWLGMAVAQEADEHSGNLLEALLSLPVGAHDELLSSIVQSLHDTFLTRAKRGVPQSSSGGDSILERVRRRFGLSTTSLSLSHDKCSSVRVDLGCLDDFCVLEQNEAHDITALTVDGAEPSLRQLTVGRAGEALAAAWLEHVRRQRQFDAFCDEALKVSWCNANVEAQLPYDITLLRGGDATAAHYVEVKATSTDESHVVFGVSMNHLDFAKRHPTNYWILRLWVNQDGQNQWRIRRLRLIGRVFDALESKAIRILLQI